MPEKTDPESKGASPPRERDELLRLIHETKEQKKKIDEQEVQSDSEAEPDEEDMVLYKQAAEGQISDLSNLLDTDTNEATMEEKLGGSIPIKQVEYQLINDYEELREMSSTTNLNTYQIQRLDEIQDRMESAQNYEAVSATVSNIINTAQSITYNIRKYNNLG
ncbi:hypothetical protein K9M79_00275 [Candidatus Woesearchaeota archaeon]|nr:hypothetical protein [Candidatus Woesearchaeota archaeon]